jgi:lipopolysaccharide exporter
MLEKLKNSYWFRSGFFTIGERLGAMVMGLGSLMFLTKYHLTKDDWGIWVIFLAITSILEVGRIGLLSNGLIKYLSNCTREEYPKIITASWVLNIILTCLIALVLFGLSEFIGMWSNSTELTQILKIYCITTFLLIPFFQCNFIQQANLQFMGVFFATITKVGVLFGFIIAMYFTLGKGEMSLVDLAIWQAIGSGIASIVSYLFTRAYLKFSKELDWKWVNTLFNYGKYVFGTNMSAMLYKSIDKLMLGSLVTTASAGVYELAIRVTNMTDVPTLAMANVLFPQSAKQAGDGDAALKKLYENAVVAILCVMIPAIIFVELFAEYIILFISTEEYLVAANLLRLTILYGFFMPFTVQFGTVMDATRSPKINFRFTILSMILNVVFNYIFIMKYGIYGAAYGTLLTYLTVLIMMQVILKREFKINFLDCVKNAFFFYGAGWKIAKSYLNKSN